MPEDNGPSEWQWAMRMFFSVDLMGSTELKYTKPQEWVSVIRKFYKTIQENFSIHCEQQKCGSARPKLWKGNGDELIFVSNIVKNEEIWLLFQAFKETVAEYNNSIKSSGNIASRPIRATVWTAGFPICNHMVSVDGTEGKQVDYIGSHIDAGFRITKHERHGSDRIVLSAECAYLLAKSCVEQKNESLTWHYDGRFSFKGVQLGKPIPIFAIDLRDGTKTIEDRMHGRDRSGCSVNDAFRFLAEYFISCEHWNHLPFIFEDPSTQPSLEKMKELEKLRKKMRDKELGESNNYQSEGTEADKNSGSDALSQLPDPKAIPTI